jgi:cyanophycinase
LGWRISFLVVLFSTSTLFAQTFLLLSGGAVNENGQRAFVARAGGVSGKILLIPWATGEQTDACRDYAHNFQPAKLECAPFRENMRSVAGLEKLMTQVQGATGVFFSGGNQEKIMAVLEDNPTVAPELARAYATRRIPFGGNSAGMAIMSKRMFTGRENFVAIDATRAEREPGLGLGLLPEDIIVDSHFLSVNRVNRLMSVLMSGKETFGIGVDWNSNIVIENGRKIRNLGEGYSMIVHMENSHGAPEVRGIHILGESQVWDMPLPQ